MDEEQVLLSWGEPYEKNKTGTAFSIQEQWIYGFQKYSGSGISGFRATAYLYFQSGILNSFPRLDSTLAESDKISGTIKLLQEIIFNK